jgi:hypothetical protein
MPAQTPTERPSIATTLADRYATQKVGGAYDAKEVKNQPIDFGLQDTLFETQSPTSLSPDNFNDNALDFAKSIGVSVKKYKP